MHLIFGGYAQGRLSYALKTYHKNRADVFDCAAQPLSEWNGQTILYHLEALVSQALQQNKAPNNDVIKFSDLTIDIGGYEVIYRDNMVKLAPK